MGEPPKCVFFFIVLWINNEPQPNTISWVIAHSIYAKFTFLAPVIALPAVPLIKRKQHTLSSAAIFCVFTLSLACTAILFVCRQVHALVVAAFIVFTLQNLAYFVVFVAVVSGSRILFCCEEPTQPFWRH